jgi:hypothetical protein
MDLGKPGWLATLLAEAIDQHKPEHPVLDPSLRSGRARARAYLRRVLRQSGLFYGTPQLIAAARPGAAPEEVLFVAVLRTLVRIALDIAVLCDAPPGPRREQVLLLLAATCGLFDVAQSVEEKIASLREWPVGKKLWDRAERALEQRAISLSGDPYYGLVLHNGAVYSDAQVFGRQAIDYFARGKLVPEMAERRLGYAARQKALLVEVLTALACVERRPSYPSRRAILRQIEDLGLPGEVEAPLRARVKRSFEKKPKLAQVLEPVRTRDVGRFLLEQTLLASLVDGRRSPRELVFLQELATRLRFSPEQLAGVEVEMAEFYKQNRDVVDVFTVGAGADVMGDELVDSMTRALEKNFQRLLTEVRETGELSVLLGRAARGHDLNADEKRRMREQLIDVAKAIPALAIFAAPGGVLLLIALAKVLPFNILPSAFKDEPDEEQR